MPIDLKRAVRSSDERLHDGGRIMSAPSGIPSVPVEEIVRTRRELIRLEQMRSEGRAS